MLHHPSNPFPNEVFGREASRRPGETSRHQGVEIHTLAARDRRSQLAISWLRSPGRRQLSNAHTGWRETFAHRRPAEPDAVALVLWRAGLRISEALALIASDPSPAARITAMISSTGGGSGG